MVVVMVMMVVVVVVVTEVVVGAARVDVVAVVGSVLVCETLGVTVTTTFLIVDVGFFVVAGGTAVVLSIAQAPKPDKHPVPQ